MTGEEEWKAARAWLDGDDLDEIVRKLRQLIARVPIGTPEATTTLILARPVIYVVAGVDPSTPLSFRKHRRGSTLVVTSGDGVAKKRAGGVWTYSNSDEPCPRAIAAAFDRLPEGPKP